MSMNVCVFSGRDTRDFEVRYTQGENPMAVARGTIAVDGNRKGKDGEDNASFFRCKAFGKTAEFLEKYGKKGVKFEVRAHFQSGSYKDKDGITRDGSEFIIDEIHFAESKNAAASPETNKTAEAAPADAGDGFMSIPDGDDDELPFS